MKKVLTALATALCTATSLGLVSCGSDDGDALTVTPSSISMKYDESQQLSSSGANNWCSENEFVATVDQKGLVKGNHVGSTNIIASNGSSSGKCTVTITPKYNFFDLPVLNWGANENAIRNAETHGTAEKSGNYLLYGYSNGAIPVVTMYLFENGALYGVNQLMGTDYYANAGLFLVERFQPVGKSNEMYIFADAMSPDNAKTIAGLDYMTLSSKKYTSIMYMKNTVSSNKIPRRSMNIIPSDVIKIAERMLNQ